MVKKRISNQIWLLILGLMFAVSVLVAAVLFLRPSSGTTAVILLAGEEVERLDLSKVTQSYTLRFTGKSGITNVVEVAPGKIRVQEADCPDKVCVGQGWIDTGAFPIVCLPNQLLIEIEDDGKTGADAMVQ